MDQTAAIAIGGGFLPPRYMDRVSLSPSSPLEESSVDAAYLFLALYKFKELPATPVALRADIEALLNRFNFAAFSSPQGWKLAFDLVTEQFTPGAYDGYSGEIYVISLAAHLAVANHVEITTHYHSGVNRVEAFLLNAERAHLVHSSSDFRAPFLQWLFTLFVDTHGLGQDTYPISSLARNPLSNAILYQREVHAKLSSLGRTIFLQPDASDDGTCGFYRQFSLYNDFGRPELFMPWSIAFSFLGEPDVAEPALRTILSKKLHGPLGLQDSVRWLTGAPDPETFPARIDFWNLALSEMAMLEFLHGDNQTFTSLPEVKAALESVFKGTATDISRSGNEVEIAFFLRPPRHTPCSAVMV